MIQSAPSIPFAQRLSAHVPSSAVTPTWSVRLPPASTEDAQAAQTVTGRVALALPRATCHVHLLGGQLELLLRRPHAQVIVYNDDDSALMQLFQTIQRRPDDLRKALHADHSGDPVLVQAAHTASALHQAWYGAPVQASTTQTLLAALWPVYIRLRGFIHEHLPWDALLERYNRPGTVFYADVDGQQRAAVLTALDHSPAHWVLTGSQGIQTSF